MKCPILLRWMWVVGCFLWSGGDSRKPVQGSKLARVYINSSLGRNLPQVIGRRVCCKIRCKQEIGQTLPCPGAFAHAVAFVFPSLSVPIQRTPAEVTPQGGPSRILAAGGFPDVTDSQRSLRFSLTLTTTCHRVPRRLLACSVSAPASSGLESP